MRKAIIKTLCYSEIFSYPLTFSELWQYLISSRTVTKKELKKALLKHKQYVESINGYIVLKGGGNLAKVRMERATHSRRKYTKAVFVSHILSLIPTVKLIGVSGSLSMYNAKKEDDIDLFIITSSNSLWITRFLVSTTLFLMKEKRSRGSKWAQDKICPNMLLTEDSMTISKKHRSLYVAHEIAQLKVLIDKGHVRHNFFAKNKWVLSFMPHAFPETNVKKTKKRLTHKLIIPLEFVLYKMQYAYMKKRITGEHINKRMAMFHPGKNSEAIEMLYQLKIASRLASRMGKKATSKRSKYMSLN